MKQTTLPELWYIKGSTRLKEFLVSSFYPYVIQDIIFSKTGCENKETRLSDWIKVIKKLK